MTSDDRNCAASIHTSHQDSIPACSMPWRPRDAPGVCGAGQGHVTRRGGCGDTAVEGADHPVFGRFLADFGYKKVPRPPPDSRPRPATRALLMRL
jgi:hypothetical protein